MITKTYKCTVLDCFISVTQEPKSGLGRLHFEVSSSEQLDTHTHTRARARGRTPLNE